MQDVHTIIGQTRTRLERDANAPGVTKMMAHGFKRSIGALLALRGVEDALKTCEAHVGRDSTMQDVNIEKLAMTTVMAGCTPGISRGMIFLSCEEANELLSFWVQGFPDILPRRRMTRWRGS